MKELDVIKSCKLERALLTLGLLALAFGCKDTTPCDPGQESIGTGCYAVASGGSGGGSQPSEAGAPGSAGAADNVDAAGAPSGQPSGNPDATFGTQCASNADCGGDAPVCATDPLFYCSQIECQDGEANAGACPDGWVCFKYLDNPSACVNPSSF